MAIGFKQRKQSLLCQRFLNGKSMMKKLTKEKITPGRQSWTRFSMEKGKSSHIRLTLPDLGFISVSLRPKSCTETTFLQIWQYFAVFMSFKLYVLCLCSKLALYLIIFHMCQRHCLQSANHTYWNDIFYMQPNFDGFVICFSNYVFVLEQDTLFRISPLLSSVEMRCEVTDGNLYWRLFSLG